jgi:hypothetical protein
MAKFNNLPGIKFKLVLALFILFCFDTISAQTAKPHFRAIAFYTAKNDQAHISFVHEANQWLKGAAENNQFSYDTTSNWKNMNPSFLAKYQVVLFLDTRPEDPDQRASFQQYMDHGGAWMGFHFSGFALDNSTYPQNWAWYHETFLGSGSYGSNTWRPTSAILRNESPKHPSLKGIGKTFKSSPNEWYRWTNDLRKNKDIEILLSIDPASFPLGTGPKQNEIWHSGYYPVAWSNKKYKMVYVNMGHNDIDYEHNSKKELSYTFDNADQNRFILNTLLWLGRAAK